MNLLRTIRNCEVKIAMPCPQRWEALAETGEASVRHCDVCDRKVHFCSTDEETLDHARAGDCIARDAPGPGTVMIGRPIEGQRREHSEEELQRRALRRREHGIDWVLRGPFTPEDRLCPDCAYPVPSFRVSCMVCGTRLGRGR